MSAMVISSISRLVGMLHKLQEAGVSNIHFYNLKNSGDLNTPIVSLVPFMDIIVLGKDADLSPQLNQVMDEAIARHIPVLSEKCLEGLKNFC